MAKIAHFWRYTSPMWLFSKTNCHRLSSRGHFITQRWTAGSLQGGDEDWATPRKVKLGQNRVAMINRQKQWKKLLLVGSNVLYFIIDDDLSRKKSDRGGVSSKWGNFGHFLLFWEVFSPLHPLEVLTIPNSVWNAYQSSFWMQQGRIDPSGRNCFHLFSLFLAVDHSNPLLA